MQFSKLLLKQLNFALKSSQMQNSLGHVMFGEEIISECLLFAMFILQVLFSSKLKKYLVHQYITVFKQNKSAIRTHET